MKSRAALFLEKHSKIHEGTSDYSYSLNLSVFKHDWEEEGQKDKKAECNFSIQQQNFPSKKEAIDDLMSKLQEHLAGLPQDESFNESDMDLYHEMTRAYQDNQDKKAYELAQKLIDSKEIDAERMKDVTHIVNSLKSKNESLREVRVTYSDGTEIETNMAAGLSDEQIRDYFKIGKEFNVGSGPNDKMAKVTKVDILN